MDMYVLEVVGEGQISSDNDHRNSHATAPYKKYNNEDVF